MQGLPKTIVIDKRVGETPLQALDALRLRDPRFAAVKLAYAGRLDPMACGKLLVVVGEECKKHAAYLGFDKEYVIEVAFGVSSDTGDVLGIATACEPVPIERRALLRAVKARIGKSVMPFPIYSSKPVRGKPLFQWALEGKLDEIDVPIQESLIYDMHLDSLEAVSSEGLQKRIYESIESLPHVIEASKAEGKDFRRDEVRASWKRIFDERRQDPYMVAKIRVVCSSGTYMRTLAETLAQDLGTCGLALSIKRTKIGSYARFGLWLKRF
jgi:tRNA pseudouridine55 synthase